MSDRYILDGHTPVPCPDLMTWARWIESNRDAKRVASTEKNGLRVSTVFLGVDHGFVEGAAPLIFETMIFGGEHDDYQTRCSTWEQAEEMHKAACEIAGIEP